MVSICISQIPLKHQLDQPDDVKRLYNDLMPVVRKMAACLHRLQYTVAESFCYIHNLTTYLDIIVDEELVRKHFQDSMLLRESCKHHFILDQREYFLSSLRKLKSDDVKRLVLLWCFQLRVENSFTIIKFDRCVTFAHHVIDQAKRLQQYMNTILGKEDPLLFVVLLTKSFYYDMKSFANSKEKTDLPVLACSEPGFDVINLYERYYLKSATQAFVVLYHLDEQSTDISCLLRCTCLSRIDSSMVLAYFSMHQILPECGAAKLMVTYGRSRSLYKYDGTNYSITDEEIQFVKEWVLLFNILEDDMLSENVDEETRQNTNGTVKFCFQTLGDFFAAQFLFKNFDTNDHRLLDDYGMLEEKCRTRIYATILKILLLDDSETFKGIRIFFNEMLKSKQLTLEKSKLGSFVTPNITSLSCDDLSVIRHKNFNDYLASCFKVSHVHCNDVLANCEFAETRFWIRRCIVEHERRQPLFKLLIDKIKYQKLDLFNTFCYYLNNTYAIFVNALRKLFMQIKRLL